MIGGEEFIYDELILSLEDLENELKGIKINSDLFTADENLDELNEIEEDENELNENDEENNEEEDQ